MFEFYNLIFHSLSVRFPYPEWLMKSWKTRIECQGTMKTYSHTKRQYHIVQLLTSFSEAGRNQRTHKDTHKVFFSVLFTPAELNFKHRHTFCYLFMMGPRQKIIFLPQIFFLSVQPLPGSRHEDYHHNPSFASRTSSPSCISPTHWNRPICPHITLASCSTLLIAPHTQQSIILISLLLPSSVWQNMCWGSEAIIFEAVADWFCDHVWLFSGCGGGSGDAWHRAPSPVILHFSVLIKCTVTEW